jgi:peptide/nickel transport system substrate-binding protein
MKRKRLYPAIASAMAIALAASACGGSESGGDGDGGSGPASTTEAAFNAGAEKIFNPSDKKGGTIKFANNGEWDSLDMADTYYGYAWNFSRLYARTLLMFKPAPGDEGNELVPDLAEDLGTPSEDQKTWTYKIKKGVKYENGTEVKAADVKYGVLRSIDKVTFPDGPTYFNDFLDLPEGYEGPYKSASMDTDQAIETPDDYTVVFHLKQPLSSFDYFAQLVSTAPVPADEGGNKGAKYQDHIISSGPYKFEDNQPGKSFAMARNDQWDQKTDEYRKALPDRYEVTLNMNADSLDQAVMDGSINLDIVGDGVEPAAQGTILPDPDLKAQADNAELARLWYTSINPTVKPFDNKDCRVAVEYAADLTGYQTAYGGPFSGGEVATTVMPPLIPGYKKFDLYETPEHKGDVDKAKDALEKCGQPDGFETNISYRNERPKEKAAAESLQQSLGRVGIKLTLKGYAQGDYFSQFAGNPPFVVANKLGLVINGWGADWNDGFGFLSQIVDSRVIRETGGSSNTSVRIPEVDQLIDDAVNEQDTAKREGLWTDIDKRVMEEAVILPGVYAKSLLFRGKGLTNVFISPAFSMYDYLALGVDQG